MATSKDRSESPCQSRSSRTSATVAGVSRKSRPSSACCRRRLSTTSGGCSHSTTMRRSSARSSNMRKIRAHVAPLGGLARSLRWAAGRVSSARIFSISEGSYRARPAKSAAGVSAPAFSRARNLTDETPSRFAAVALVTHPEITLRIMRGDRVGSISAFCQVGPVSQGPDRDVRKVGPTR